MHIEILLRNRIGDTIMGLPALICLRQLQEKYGPLKPNVKVDVYVIPSMLELVKSLNLYECKTVTGMYRLKSWFQPADHTFVLYPHSRNVFLNSKKSYGLVSPNKWYLKYDKEMPYLYVEHYDANMPEGLVTFLKAQYGFSGGIIRYFGICLELGYTVEQIIENFLFDASQVDLSSHLTVPEALGQEDYLVFCMEAAYDSRREATRRWPEASYFELAEWAYQIGGFRSVFLGLKQDPVIPQKPYLIDLRKERPLMEVAGIIKHSQGYIGNDTGFLHLASLLQTPSLCIYSKTDPETYGPVFPKLNTPVRFPQVTADVIPALETFLTGLSKAHLTTGSLG